MKHLDLFSGIGGFALAARWAGFETVQFVELDSFAQKVLKKNFPGVPIHDNIKTFQATEFRGLRLVTGGYPCQPFSQAGKRRGQEDDRHLRPEMFRIIREARPSWVLCENVAGHISMGLDEVLFDLEGEGYDCQSFVIPAVAKDAKHRRDRVWIIANSIGSGRSGGEGCMETDRCNLREEVQTRIGTPEDVANPVGIGSRGGTMEDQRSDGDFKLRPFIIERGPERIASRENVANPNSIRFNSREPEIKLRETNHISTDNTGRRENVANSNSFGFTGGKDSGHNRYMVNDGSEILCNEGETERSGFWSPEPSVGRVADGVPGRVDRLKGLGNAIVPQIAYEIMKGIYDSDY